MFHHIEFSVAHLPDFVTVDLGVEEEDVDGQDHEARGDYEDQTQARVTHRSLEVKHRI